MNYAAIAQNFIGLFPSKITVTLTDAISNKVITTYKVKKTELPSSFQKPTTINEWRVVRIEYLRKKNLVLYVVDSSADFPINNLVPTKTLLPDVVPGEVSGLVIDPHSWRQLEFLPSSALPAVTEEFPVIEEIISSGGLLGYNQCHIRLTDIPSYQLPLAELLEVTKGKMSGNVYLKNTGVIENSFHVIAEDNVYYGLVKDGYITLLCLENFDSINEELANVLSHYDLILVDWCQAQAIS